MLVGVTSSSEPYLRRLGIVLNTSFTAIGEKGERNIFHFMSNDKRSVQMMGEAYINTNIQKCFECKREGYLFL